jgi:hypothetical protein
MFLMFSISLKSIPGARSYSPFQETNANRLTYGICQCARKRTLSTAWQPLTVVASKSNPAHFFGLKRTSNILGQRFPVTNKRSSLAS